MCFNKVAPTALEQQKKDRMNAQGKKYRDGTGKGKCNIANLSGETKAKRQAQNAKRNIREVNAKTVKPTLANTVKTRQT
eukprot:331938-Prorocentrum_minimum.AAC.1